MRKPKRATTTGSRRRPHMFFVLNLFRLCAIMFRMHLFLTLLFPLAFFIWLRGQKGADAPRFFNAFMGVFLAAVFCAYKYFFSPYYFITPDSFWRNFLHIFIEQILLPLGVLTAAFLFIFKKDKLADRLEKLFPLYAGFYAVYLHFRALNEPLPHPAFALFAKPIFFLLMLLALNERQKVLFVPSRRAMLKAGEAAVEWLLFAVDLLMPAAVEALWLLGMRAPLTILFVLLYAASVVFCLVKSARSRE